MDTLTIVKFLNCISEIWDLFKKFLNVGKNSSPPDSDEQDKKQQKLIKRFNENIMRLREDDVGLQCLAINDLEQIARGHETDKGLREIICISLCQFLSSNPKSRHALYALFRKDSIFAPMYKEIKSAEFLKLNLSRTSIIENVRFEDCKFVECCFNNVHFQDCHISGGEMDGCDFKDDIKWNGCHIKDVQMKNLYFRHADFNSVTFQGGIISSSTFLRSELRDVTFFNTHLGNLVFEICKFQREGFIQCQMNNVKYKYKNSEERCILDMQKALIHQGYQPFVEHDSMTLAVG